jgi:hypothetical protein
MSQCPNIITEIDRTEFIGNSLTTINNNFVNLQTVACTNNTIIDNVSLTATTINNNLTTLNNITSFGAAKALVKFDGTIDSDNILSPLFTNRKIYKQHNVVSVYKKGNGDYRVRFITPFPAPDYLVICSNSEVLKDGKYGWSSPYFLTEDYVDIRVSNNADPTHVSVVVFNF